MDIAEVIDYDVECVREYCRRLIVFADASPKDFIPPHSKRRNGTQYLPINVSHLVRPDLICNIYSLLDYRLKSLCEYHEKKNKHRDTFEQFKRKDKSRTSDLDRYRRYFQSVVNIDLRPVLPSFKHLDLLRRIRNAYIHSGGHADADTVSLVTGVPGISLYASLLIVHDEYIYGSLEHTSRFLQAIAET